MAKAIMYRDDIDNSLFDPEAGEGRTVSFSFEGTQYALDLTNDNAAKFAKAIDKWITAATVVNAKPARITSGRSGARARKDYLNRVREWAEKNNHEYTTKGRLPAETIDAYHEAHPDEKRA